jgi:predicted transcriptional regulator
MPFKKSRSVSLNILNLLIYLTERRLTCFNVTTKYKPEEVNNLSSSNKVKDLLKRFQHERRAKRREKLLQMFVELHCEFDSLLPAIGANITDLLGLAVIFHQVDRAVGIIKRYKQLANEARHLGLEPPPDPQLPQGITEAYVLVVGRRPRATPMAKGVN